MQGSDLHDSKGRLIIGDPTKGCRHCGTVEHRVSESGHAIIYMPGRTCCVGATMDQIERLKEHKSQTGAELAVVVAKLQELREELEFAEGKDEARLQRNLERAERGMPVVRSRFMKQLAEITADIKELQNHLRTLEGL